MHKAINEPSEHTLQMRLAAVESNYQPLPCVPTDAIPGSAAKVAILAQRFRDGELMHHELDARHRHRMRSKEYDAQVSEARRFAHATVRES